MWAISSGGPLNKDRRQPLRSTRVELIGWQGPAHAASPLSGGRDLRKIIVNPTSDAVHHADGSNNTSSRKDEEYDNRPVRHSGQCSTTIVGFGTKLSRR